jgi:membrane-associated phospholipid phosphatase
MTRWAIAVALSISVGVASLAQAQTESGAHASSTDPEEAVPAPTPQPQAQQPQEQQQPAAQKQGSKHDPVLPGEEETKPTRGFVSALVHNLGDDVKHMPRQNSIYWVAGGGALALAVHPADKNINSHLENTSNGFWVAGHIIGATETILGAAGATYAIGRWKHMQRLQHLGMDEIEAAILAEGLTEGLKAVVRRPRPTPLPGQTQSSTYSFPSGHAMTTFAAATVLQQHLGYKAGIPTYIIASYVAMSRLHDNQHFASDVVFGSALGVVVGRSVTWHGRNYYATPMLVPKGAGIQVAVLPSSKGEPQ